MTEMSDYSPSGLMLVHAGEILHLSAEPKCVNHRYTNTPTTLSQGHKLKSIVVSSDAPLTLEPPYELSQLVLYFLFFLLSFSLSIELLVGHPMKSHKPPETDDQGTKS